MARPFELQSRDEEILASIIDGTEYTEEDQSRIEYLLLELKGVIKAAIAASPIKYKGSKASIAALPTVSKTPEGYMYTLISGGTTTSDFVEGAGHTIPDGENVAAVNIGTKETPVMKWDTLGGITDGLQAEITALNKLSADLVDDANATHKFATSEQLAQIAANKRDIVNARGKIMLITDELDTKLPDKGDHTTINGVDVYVSTTQPTGDIAEGSIGFGW